MAVDGSLKFDTLINAKGFQAGINNLVGSVKKLGAAIGIAFGVAAIVQFSKASITASNNLENAMIGLKSITQGQGRSFSQAKGFIEEYIADGLIPATDAVTAYKNLAMRGYDDKQIRQVMNAFKDSSAFGRQASLSMGEAVKSASEGIKNENSILVDNAGVTKNVSMMWKDYAASIGTTVQSLTKQQKIQAEVLGIMEETRFQTGDAAKMSDTYTGSVLRMQYAMNDMKIAFGNFLKPIMSVLIPVITTAITVLTKFFNILAQISSLLFGKKVTAVSQAQEQEAAIGGAAKNQKELAGATKKANEEAKKQLYSFDEIEKLSSDTYANGGGAGGGGGGAAMGGGVDIAEGEGMADFEIPQNIIAFIENFKAAIAPTVEALKRLNESLEPLKTFASKGLEDFYNSFLKPVGGWVLGEGIPRFIDGFTKMAKEIDWETLNGAFDKLWKALAPFAINIGEGLLWFWENVLVPLGTWTMNEIVPLFLDGLTSVLKILNAVIEALKPLAMWFFETFLKPLGEFAGAMMIGALTTITDLLSKFAKWCQDNDKTIQDTAITIGTFFAIWETTKLFAFIQMSGGVVSSLLAIATATKTAMLSKLTDKAETVALTAMYAKDFVVSVAQSTLALGKQAAAFVVSTAAKIADRLELIAMNVATTAWTVLCATATAVTTAFGAAFAFLTSPIGLVILAIGALIVLVVGIIKNWDELKVGAEYCWNGIVETWNNAGVWFSKTVVEPIKKVFTELWDNVSKKASEIYEGIKVVWMGLAKWFGETVITPVITAFDTFWSGISAFAQTCWTTIKDVFLKAKEWFDNNVINPITKGFKTFVQGLVDMAFGFANGFIAGINGIKNALNLLSFDIPDWVPIIGGNSFGFSFTETKPLSIPQLAQGAVIPPNREFLAVLGDQKHGTNIETPLSTMVEAFKMASTQVGGSGNRDITIVLEMNKREFARATYKANNEEKQRVGLRLSGVY